MLKPGEVVPVDIPVWPASAELPAGYVLELLVAGRDFARELDPAAPNATRGSGLYTHRDPADRPAARFNGMYTLHAAPGKEPFLLMPIIPG
jgi:hypothetical protein